MSAQDGTEKLVTGESSTANTNSTAAAVSSTGTGKEIQLSEIVVDEGQVSMPKCLVCHLFLLRAVFSSLT